MPAAVSDAPGWDETDRRVAAFLADPLAEFDAERVDAAYRAVRRTFPADPPARITVAGDGVMLSWRGGRTRLLAAG